MDVRDSWLVEFVKSSGRDTSGVADSLKMVICGGRRMYVSEAVEIIDDKAEDLVGKGHEYHRGTQREERR